jgi:antitoxin HicB
MIKNLNYYLNLDYSIRLKENSDGSYFAEIEELPGCITEGDSKEEALQMIDDAKKAWLSVALEDGNPIPEPMNDDFSGKLNVRLPKYLHRHLAYRAKREGVSLNTLISTSLSATMVPNAQI